VLKSLRNYSQGQGLRTGHSYFTGWAIGEDTRQFEDFCNPAPIVFLFGLNRELQNRLFHLNGLVCSLREGQPIMHCPP